MIVKITKQITIWETIPIDCHLNESNLISSLIRKSQDYVYGKIMYKGTW